MSWAACTIVSFNYLPYARTLCDSFHKYHPDQTLYVLLVDRLPPGYDRSSEKFKLILAEELGIPDFPSIAFKYGILELNTNVKPTFLKRILQDGVDRVIYFDPDILVCAPLEPILQSLSRSSIVLTPHCTSPNEAGPYSEVLLLVDGVFNLGFIAISKSDEAARFLDWWERRCLSLGYKERWAGLFVDQKWINLVPCYYDSVDVLKHAGCNVAYWNLHERTLRKAPSGWLVNESWPLIFFHFSGIHIDGGTRISKHTEQFDLSSRPDLAELFALYREQIAAHGIRETRAEGYAFGKFSNGEPVNALQRAAFAANLESFAGTDPFDAGEPFFNWAKRHNLRSTANSVESYNRKAYRKTDTRVRAVNGMLRLALRALGADRYAILMKYLEFASVLRNQKDILGDIDES